MKRAAIGLLGLLVLLGASLPVGAQMPNPKEMSGIARPDNAVPVGTITVRVIRGTFDKNLPGQPVEFTIDGEKRTVATDASGRAEVSNLRKGARVRAATVVDGERLESEEAVIGAGAGFRVVLVATDRAAAGSGAAAPASPPAAAPPAERGTVVFGETSRVIAELSDERLNIFYALDIVNSANHPVDLGGPLIVDLPREARGAAVLQGSSKQATAKGPRVIVTGPFAPGSTLVQIGYELPYSGPSAHLRQVWPAPLAVLTMYVLRLGQVDISSPQVASKQEAVEQGQPLIFATGPPIPAGQALVVDFSGLPHHARWPRYLALGLAGAIMSAGIWAAVFARPRRRGNA